MLQRRDEVGDARRDLGAEARAVEHAVMADAASAGNAPCGRSGMLMHSSCAASVWPTPEMSSFSPSTVMQAARRIAVEIDGLAAMRHLALRQRVMDEHVVDCLQIDTRPSGP